MELYWKALAIALTAAVLGVTVQRQEKEMFLLLAVSGCIVVGVIFLHFLEPVISFLRELEARGNLQTDMLTILLKAVGIGIVSELAAMICTDSGNAGLGKVLHLLGTGVILWICLPIFRSTLELIETILGEI